MRWMLCLMGLYGKIGWLKWPSQRHKQKAMEALDKMGMADYAKRQISQLSGGQQQRVFLARALIQDADLYFMDEPLAGVDAATEQAIMTILRELKKNGKTVLVVHHDLQTVDQYFDHVLLLNRTVIHHGPTEKVFTPEHIAETYGGALRWMKGERYDAHLVYNDMQWVLVSTSLLGMAAGMIGCLAYWNRQSLMSDSLSHAALPGIVVAFMLLGEKHLLILIAGAAVSALIGALLIQWVTAASRIKEDTAMGIVLSVFFGLGTMLLTIVNRTSTGNQSGLDNFIFGQAATMVRSDVYMSGCWR